MSSKWFGTLEADISDFAVIGCTALTLTTQGGRFVTIYTGAVPSGCLVEWLDAGDYVTLLVNITDTSNFWSVSLPLNDTNKAESSCSGGTSVCNLATPTPCNNLASIINQQATPGMHFK